MVWRAPLVRPPDDEAMAALLTELRRLGAAVADPEADRRRPAGRRATSACASSGRSATLSRRARGDRRGEARPRREQAVAEAIADLGARRPPAARLRQPRPAGCCAVSADRGGRTAARPRGRSTRSTSTSRRALRPPPAEPGRRAPRRRGTRPRRCSTRPTTSLADLLLPATVARSDRPLVVVPTGVLHGVPWTRPRRRSRGRAVAVSPSLERVVDGGQARPGRTVAGGPRAAPRRRRSSPARRCGSPTPRSRAGPARTTGPSCSPAADGDRRRRASTCSARRTSSTWPATARSAPTTRCSRRWRWPTGR